MIKLNGIEFGWKEGVRYGTSVTDRIQARVSRFLLRRHDEHNRKQTCTDSEKKEKEKKSEIKNSITHHLCYKFYISHVLLLHYILSKSTSTKKGSYFVFRANSLRRRFFCQPALNNQDEAGCIQVWKTRKTGEYQGILSGQENRGKVKELDERDWNFEKT